MKKCIKKHRQELYFEFPEGTFHFDTLQTEMTVNISKCQTLVCFSLFILQSFNFSILQFLLLPPTDHTDYPDSWINNLMTLNFSLFTFHFSL